VGGYGKDVGRAAGVLYAVDLFGACMGAAIVGPFSIPILGLVGICWWTALLDTGLPGSCCDAIPPAGQPHIRRKHHRKC